MAVGQRLRELDNRVLGPPGSIDLRRPVAAVRAGPATVAAGTAERPGRTHPDRTARNGLALLGALASVTLLAAYYVPGLRDSAGIGSMVLLLSVPAAALALPFTLLALLLRVRAVWLACGLLMLLTVGAFAKDLFDGTGSGSSLVGFFLLFILNLGLLGLALVVDVAVSGTRRVVHHGTPDRAEAC